MGNIDLNERAIWAPLLEKAWSKIKGSYMSADGGFIQNGMRALVGCPVFTYWTPDESDYTDTTDYQIEYNETWTLLRELDLAGDYLLGAATASSSSKYNSYSVANGHAFSILSVFPLRDTQGEIEYKLYMVRNPWSDTYYNGDFHYVDSKWTDHRKSQIPFDVDPYDSWENGIFFIT